MLINYRELFGKDAAKSNQQDTGEISLTHWGKVVTQAVVDFLRRNGRQRKCGRNNIQILVSRAHAQQIITLLIKKTKFLHQGDEECVLKQHVY